MLGSKEIGKPLLMKKQYRKGASIKEVVTAKVILIALGKKDEKGISGDIMVIEHRKKFFFHVFAFNQLFKQIPNAGLH